MKSPRDFVFGAALGISLGVALGAPVSAISQLPGLMSGVWRGAQIINSRYLYEVNSADMEQGALDGMMLAARIRAKDPYSRIMSPQEAKEEDQAVGPEAAADPGVHWELARRQVGGQGPWHLTAVLDIDSFMDDDVNDRIDQALGEISRSGAQSLVIDLRGNTGGYLDAGEHLADRLMDSGVIARYEGRGGRGARERQAQGRADDLKLPAVVLVDGMTASASEVAAAALQDSGRARLMGSVTRGKGRVQESHDLPGGARMILTTERWLTPKGTDIQGLGLKPDVQGVHCVGIEDTFKAPPEVVTPAEVAARASGNAAAAARSALKEDLLLRCALEVAATPAS